MSVSPETIVIVGANVGGARAADTLRQEGFEGRVVLVGAEPDLPYERPALSKELLWGTMSEEKVFLHAREYYDEQRIELRLGLRATGLDPAAHEVALEDGTRLRYDRLLVTTGATPRRLNVPGAEMDGLLYLRTLADARQLRRRVQTASRVVVVGTGFIGAEAAASCRGLGKEVVALEAAPVPLERALGPEVGRLYAEIHRGHGVDLRVGAAVTGFSGQGRVEAVETTSGTRIEGDLFVVGVGVVPVTDWLAGSGLAVDNGVIVDELQRASVPDVYAAGDVANWWHPELSERLRVEHFDNAQNQGVAAAKSMLGRGEPYAPVPYFWSDQFGMSLQYVGHARGDDRVVLRGAVDSGSWTAFYLRDDHLRAALTVDRYKDLNPSRQLIQRRVPVTAEALADEATDLKALARGVPA